MSASSQQPHSCNHCGTRTIVFCFAPFRTINKIVQLGGASSESEPFASRRLYCTLFSKNACKNLQNKWSRSRTQPSFQRSSLVRFRKLASCKSSPRVAVGSVRIAWSFKALALALQTCLSAALFSQQTHAVFSRTATGLTLSAVAEAEYSAGASALMHALFRSHTLGVNCRASFNQTMKKESS